MQGISSHPLWQKAGSARRLQKFFGRISAVCLTVALVGLVDGLVAQMRMENNQLDLLPGQTIAVSGPAAVKNPVSSDVLATFIPPQAPVAFELEGFFTGYWFGSGMWRGNILVDASALPGRYELKIAFRGASAQSAQKYILQVYKDDAAMRAASLSLLRRFFDINPFALAALAGLFGLAWGLATYFYGRRYARLLLAMNLVEIYARQSRKVLCLCPAFLAPRAGSGIELLDGCGQIAAMAKVTGWKKGKLILELPPDQPLADEILVNLRPPTGNGCQ